MARKNWIWRGRKEAPYAEQCKEFARLRDRGIHGVLIADGIDECAFEAARVSGLEVHSWMWTTNRNDSWIRDNHPDWYMVSRGGKSCFDRPPYVDYYRWVSPVVPGFVSYMEERVAELASHPAISGVHLDYVRYPDVILPRGLWVHYGLDMTTEMPDYDFCYGVLTRSAFKELSGRDPSDISEPSKDEEWIKFRYDSITNLVKRLADTTRSNGKQITAAVFPTPDLARNICRQDWDKWPLDGVFPMTYHGFYLEGPAWVGECVAQDVKAVDFPVYPGIYMPDVKEVADFRTALRCALEHGASGVSLFGEVSDGQWDAFAEEVA